jgi:ketosteroid isomerase-like protein
MKTRYFALPVVLLLTTAALIGQETRPVAKRETIEQALSTFVTAFENLDWPTFKECFIDGATIFHPAAPNLKRVDSTEQFEEAWKGVFERIRQNSGRTAPPYMKLNPSEMRIELLSPDVGVATFHLIEGSIVGRRTVVLKRFPAGWKIVHIHASNITTR